MSQKSSRRSRRQTNEDEVSSFKTPPMKLNGEETPPIEEDAKDAVTNAKPDLNGSGNENGHVNDKNETEDKETDSNIVTRSRSQTPQKKKIDEEEVINNETNHEQSENDDEIKLVEQNNVNDAGNNVNDVDSNDVVNEVSEMEPLIITDEADPELMFDASEPESGNNSPILSQRCKTRRSSFRNIPTPKTPKLEDEPNSLLTGDNSFDDDLSTKAQAGGDSTRADFDKDNDNGSFLAISRDKSFGEALRHLSTRRTIRPLSDDYRKRVLQSNLNASYPDRYSVERVSVGRKRRNSSESASEERNKRQKGDSPGFFARLTSPFASIRGSFRPDIVSSTPKLTGYKDEKCLLEDGADKLCEVKEGERRWCSIM